MLESLGLFQCFSALCIIDSAVQDRVQIHSVNQKNSFISHVILRCMNSSLNNVPVNWFCLSIWNPSSGLAQISKFQNVDVHWWLSTSKAGLLLNRLSQHWRWENKTILPVLLKYLLTSPHQHRIYLWHFGKCSWKGSFHCWWNGIIVSDNEKYVMPFLSQWSL